MSCGTRAWTCRVGSRASGAGRTAGSVRQAPVGGRGGRRATAGSWWRTGGSATVPGLWARGAEAPGAVVLRSPRAAYQVS